ncbi:unnamed protein product [Nyctereutes procyonoides]|uniref:(raccoon dog) hypothetical protein n=1 Tax=Nyctereutes procyonoides TaxID=34880 RepID=A0A811XPT9_NYCPR|nr:unnamed protein product [Nyctereutes procyonoides]
MEAEKSQDLQLTSWRSRKADGISSSRKANRLEVQYFSLSLKARKDQCPRSSRQAGVPLCSWLCRAFVLFRPSTDWMRFTHIREENLLYSV